MNKTWNSDSIIQGDKVPFFVQITYLYKILQNLPKNVQF